MTIVVRDFSDAQKLAEKIKAAGLDPSTNSQIPMLLQAVERNDVGTAIKVGAKFAQNWNSQYDFDLNKLRTEAANIANIQADTSNFTPEAKAELQNRADGLNAKIARFNNDYGTLGFETYNVELKPDANGYITATPTARADGQVATKQNVGRAGEPLKGVQKDDGTWDVVGANSGKVYNTFPDASQANAYMTAVQSGSVPNPTGTYDFTGTAAAPYVGEVIQNTPSNGGSTILPSTIDTSGLTEEQIKAAEQAYLDASSSTSLANTLNVTDADIQGFLEKAASESDPYYSQIYTRANEDYKRGLEYKTALRQDELAQEALNAQLAKEQTQGQLGEAGLAFSGIRTKAEARLKEQADNIARANRRRFNEEITQFGRGAEELLGSKNLARTGLPQIEGSPVFTPSGNVTGSLQREQITANQTRAAELEKNARLRALGTLPESSVASEQLASLY